jgi:solute carrier family 25 (mitochondrial S-adenosylmethionine transporter), member 26
MIPAVLAQTPSAGGERQLGLQPPPAVSFTAGLLAGMAADIPLHPLDTVKTRMQTQEGFLAAGGFRSLWSGLSAVLIVSVPGSAPFFVIYEYTRHLLERRVPVVLQDSKFAIVRDAVAASLADVSACVLRVPCEVLKQRMQALHPMGAPPTFRATVRSVSQEGLRGFFAGFGATAMREVPFALLQMPLFEELKHRHPAAAKAREEGNSWQLGVIGMQAGCFAGGFAGLATTPLDTAKTRIILTQNPAERRGLFETILLIRAESGTSGLLRGMGPRALHCGVGGALWLGAFEWSKLLIWNTCT